MYNDEKTKYCQGVFMLKSGVYIVKNKITGDIYVGSSKDLVARWNQHRYTLRHKKGQNELLQGAWDKYGEKEFEFKILALVPPNKLVEIEQSLIDGLKPAYNISLEIGKFPMSYRKRQETEEYRKQVSNAVKDLWKNQEYKDCHSKPRKWKDGKPNRLGVKLTDEQKNHLSEINTGDKNPNYGKHRTDEFKQRTSNSNGRVYYGIVSPDGTVYATIQNMSRFCVNNGLCVSEMVGIARGRKKSHKGWTCLDPTKNLHTKTVGMSKVK